VSKATQSDARRAVTTVEFAPRHLGLRLASGSTNGVVWIFEALDTMNLNHWKLEAEIDDSPDRDEAGEIVSSNGNWVCRAFRGARDGSSRPPSSLDAPLAGC